MWEGEGRPEGRHLDHWQHAEDQLEATERAAEVEVEQIASEKPKKKSEVPPTAPPTKKVAM
ncbi:DUF2934 domain-containing protein [Rhizobium sp. BK376]|uniref:DUF2934 domain-containing protein n=1 Tax=Rhizobium sp. BK376 TaxID=2512149 RepID=UPI001FE0D487|nr:DUF2934 domain-containing protein [Rhizobium sp. BK376]